MTCDMDHGVIAYLLNAQGRDAGTGVPANALSTRVNGDADTMDLR
jgi:hypothetical protein